MLSRLMTRTFENKLPSHLPPPSPRRTRFTRVTWFFTVAEIPRRGNPRRFCSTHLDYPRRRSIITALDYGGRVRSGFFRVGKIIPCNLFTAAKSFREVSSVVPSKSTMKISPLPSSLLYFAMRYPRNPVQRGSLMNGPVHPFR